jgi:hypothetical protein
LGYRNKDGKRGKWIDGNIDRERGGEREGRVR